MRLTSLNLPCVVNGWTLHSRVRTKYGSTKYNVSCPKCGSKSVKSTYDCRQHQHCRKCSIKERQENAQPSYKYKVYSFRIQNETLEKINEILEHKDITMAELLRKACSNYVKKNEHYLQSDKKKKRNSL